jgi:hypothetical protein
LNYELKSEFGTNSNNEEEDEDMKFCSLKVPIDAADKDSKINLVKIRKYDVGFPEEFLNWRMTLNEQMKNHGCGKNYEMLMNLSHAMMAGRGLDAFLNGRRAQDRKNKSRKANKQPELTLHQIYDCTIFEFIIRAFDIQSGWRDTFERQREYTGENTFSWVDSILRNSVKGCRT